MAHVPVVLVDGENVRRSRWPNVSADELVERCCEWARAAGAEAVVVFDGGEAGERAVDDRCAVARSGAESADDWLVRRAAELDAAGRAYWLVTSDRALRNVAGRHAQRVIGGGGFLSELSVSRRGR
jgi:predicted RNA-binding protein with PIN domain